jgi:uncharacterized membrane protein
MDSTPPPITVTDVSVTEDKTVAILSYLTLVGFIVAIVMHGNKKTRLGSFHLRQALGLMLTAVAFAMLLWLLAFIPFVGWLAIPVLWLGLLVLWIMGLVAAASGKLTPVPLLGEHYQKWFSSAFD